MTGVFCKSLYKRNKKTYSSILMTKKGTNWKIPFCYWGDHGISEVKVEEKFNILWWMYSVKDIQEHCEHCLVQIGSKLFIQQIVHTSNSRLYNMT